MSEARKPAKEISQKTLPSEAEIRSMPESDYMSPRQLSFFASRLNEMRSDVLGRQRSLRDQLSTDEMHADPADQATAEEDRALALSLRQRDLDLLKDIDDALGRISSHEYGYCSQTGEPIGIPRLIARPTASVSVQVKDHGEKIGLHYRAR